MWEHSRYYTHIIYDIGTFKHTYTYSGYIVQ